MDISNKRKFQLMDENMVDVEVGDILDKKVRVEIVQENYAITEEL